MPEPISLIRLGCVVNCHPWESVILSGSVHRAPSWENLFVSKGQSFLLKDDSNASFTVARTCRELQKSQGLPQNTHSIWKDT